jgi:hypothetical protein
MTSLVVWLGVDSRGPASIYIASDSRITWGSSSIKWDHSQKVFSSQKYPDIIGYCGDVLFPSQLLAQIIRLIDAGMLFENSDIPIIKFNKITKVIQEAFEAYPKSERRNFAIIYCTREYEGMASIFHAFLLDWKLKNGWHTDLIALPKTEDGQKYKSGIVRPFGSGAKSIKKWYDRWNKIKSEKDTSRTVFNAFCDSLFSKEDEFSGGAPQLVALYRIDCGKYIGTVYQRNRYLFGLPILDSGQLNNIEWRNNVFERCDGITMEKLNNAQSHKRPRGLAKEKDN